MTTATTGTTARTTGTTTVTTAATTATTGTATTTDPPPSARERGRGPDGRAVVAGHGWYVRGTGDTDMPSDAWGYFHVADGVGLRRSVGLAMEQGKKIKPTEIVGPGKSLPAICRKHCDPRR
ncbi:putative adhesin [Streptomyces sp. CMC78]|uniref:putative adhesin n=1 Tax=Streptomyces sp. CMC78 TaxID=3231512 RepID=UPI0038B41CDA